MFVKPAFNFSLIKRAIVRHFVGFMEGVMNPVDMSELEKLIYYIKAYHPQLHIFYSIEWDWLWVTYPNMVRKKYTSASTFDDIDADVAINKKHL